MKKGLYTPTAENLPKISIGVFFLFVDVGGLGLTFFVVGGSIFFITLLSLIFLIWFEKLRNNRMEIELPGCQSQKFSEKRLCF